MKKTTLIFLGLVFWATSSFAQSKNEAFVLCRNKKTVRTIRVEKQNQAFQTIYTKAGVDKTVGEAQWYESAFTILKNIKTNLEGAGWSCAEVENFEVKHSATNP
jgi:hypothetical protein